MTAWRILQLGIFLGALLGSQGTSAGNEPSAAAASQTPPATREPGEGGATTSTLRVEVSGLHLRILRSDLAGAVPLASLMLPAPAREVPLLLGRAAYVTVEGEGVLVIDIGVPTDPYIVWQLARDRSVLSLSLWQDRLRLETPNGSLVYDLAQPLRPLGPELRRIAPRRFYPTAPPSLVAQGLPQFPADAPSGRRIWLRSGERRVGRLHRLPDGSLFCDGRAVPIEDIQRIDAVYLDEPEHDLVAAPPPPQPGVTSPIRRQPEDTPLEEVWTLAAFVDGSADQLVYRTSGTRFEVLRKNGSDEKLLGVATLPEPARSPVLLRFPVAIVLLQHGAAVIDVTLARYPYVAWLLEPTVAVESMQLQQGILMLRRSDFHVRYDMALPLLPSGANRQAQSIRRQTDQSVTAADASWLERPGPAKSVRRLYLRGMPPRLVWDLSCSTETARCRWLEDKAEDSATIADIEHIEAVQAPPRATSTKEPPARASASPPGRQAVYSWAHLAGPTGYRLTTNPLRIVGIVLGVGGGTGAYALGMSALTLGIGLPYVGQLGRDEERKTLAIAAGVALVVGLVGGGVAIAAPDQQVPVPR